MENGYAITMGMLAGGFAIIIFGAWPEIKKILVSLKNDTFAKGH